MRFWVGNLLYVYPLSGSAMKPILESSVEISKGTDYDFFKAWLGNGLLLSNGAEWKAQRATLTPTFHFTILNDFMQIFDRQTKILLEKMQEHADNGKMVDIYEMVAACSVDIIGEAGMGVELKTQQNRDHPYLKAVKDFNKYNFYYFQTPYYWIDSIWNMFGYGKQCAAAVKTMKGTSTGIIKERIKVIEGTQGSDLEHNPTNKKKMAFLDLLLSQQSENKMPFELLRDQVDTFMFGGHDTITQAIAWTIWSLACHAEIQEKLYQELLEKYGVDAGEISSNSLNQSKYLDRCIKESMRVFSPVPIISRALNNDMEIGGKLVPSGSVIAISPILVHHNYLVYKEHDVYNPDNFLPEECAKRHAYDYIPFSAGPRNCIGQKYAQLEMKVILIHLLLRFQLSTDYAFHANGRSTESVLVPQLGVPVYLKTR